jgi:hypothetical protein
LRSRLELIFGVAFVVVAAAVAQARDIEMGGDSNYPYSIMAPEPGTASHHRATVSNRARHLKQNTPSRLIMTRGSSGSVLPTPLPRTQLIPPEGGGALAVHPAPREQGPTILPGLNPIPNLPHGPETFQDRASRCAQQQGLYGVPASASGLYMHTCAM